MDLLNSTPTKTYYDNLDTLTALKGGFQTLHLMWSDIEGTGSGTTSGPFTDPYGALALFDSIAANQGIKLSLTIRPIDATGKTVPADLSNIRFHESGFVMSTRFKKMLDFVFTKINPNHLTGLFIGNEIDNYNPGSDSNFWTDYGAFLDAVHYFILNTTPTYSNLKIGFTATHPGLVDTTKLLAGGANSTAVMLAYSEHVDIVGVTYYPLNPDFTVQPPSAVHSDFQNLVNKYANPIHVQEVGYPTATVNNSNEDTQAQFFCELFHTWDTFKTRIPNISVLRLNDSSRAEAEEMAIPYGLASEGFIEYLRTLGVISYSAIDKPSFHLIKSELQKRSF